MAIKNFDFSSLKRSINVTAFVTRFDFFWKIKIILLLSSIYLIFEALFGTQIGILNPAITVIWIGWWIAIVVIYLPFNAKNWCAVCPIPVIGQIYNRYAPLRWLQSKKINKKLTLYGFLPILLFLVFSALSVPISTIPMITGIVLLILFLFSTFTDVYYGERTFCREFCPINPLLQTYNTIRSVSLQTLDFSICTTQHEKTCMIGDAQSFGCDWGFFPGKLKKNENDCTNCCDCLKSCNYNNLSLVVKKTRLFPNDDENIKWIRTFLPLFFLSIAIMYSITKIAALEPFHRLILIKNIFDMVIALITESFFIFVVIPLLFLLFVIFPLYKFVNNKKSRIFLIKRSTFVSIPLSLAIWIVFTIYLIIPNVNLLMFWLADPFSLNWNILNLKEITLYSGILKEIFNYLGQIILIIGYYFTLFYSYNLVSSSDMTLGKKYICTLGQFVFYTLLFIIISLIYL